jgi:hypothetical protein
VYEEVDVVDGTQDDIRMRVIEWRRSDFDKRGRKRMRGTLMRVRHD